MDIKALPKALSGAFLYARMIFFLQEPLKPMKTGSLTKNFNTKYLSAFFHREIYTFISKLNKI